MENIELWHEQRHRDVTSAFGDLALEGLYEVKEKSTFAHIPGIWSPSQSSGLEVVLQQKDQAYDEQDKLVLGDYKLAVDKQYIKYGEHFYAMATAQPGSPYLLAIYNSKHEALARFSHIDSYKYDEAFIYEGHYEEVEEQVFNFLHTGDVQNGQLEQGRTHESSRTVKVTIGEKQFAFRPFRSGTVDIIVFRDVTSDSETYSVGRMIIVEPLADGKVKLDFNKTFLPPCAFSPHFNCPMPPFSNRVHIPITAGEKKVVWR